MDCAVVINNLTEFDLQGHVSEFSFTLTPENQHANTKKENFSEIEKLVLTFTNEADFAAWYDAFQMKLKDIISISHLKFSPHSLFQIYAVLSINHGISKIERELLSYQPSVPPLPPSPKHYQVSDVKPCTPRERKTTIRARRNTSWIDELIAIDNFKVGHDNDDDDDIDLDKIVDAKLCELTIDSNKLMLQDKKDGEVQDIISPRSSDLVTRTNSPRSKTMVSPRTENPVWVRQGAKGTRKSILLRRTSKNLDAPLRKTQH